MSTRSRTEYGSTTNEVGGTVQLQKSLMNAYRLNRSLKPSTAQALNPAVFIKAAVAV
jgi:hypothetical protein